MRTAEGRGGENETLREEYEFSGGIRGKYARRFAKGSNVVVLAPDVAAEFPTAGAVNRALRAQLSRRASRRKPRRGRAGGARRIGAGKAP